MSINQSIITDQVCIDCGEGLMFDLSEEAYFSTERGTEYDAEGGTGFDCHARFLNAFMPHRIVNHVCFTDDSFCGECG
jgi:hypothetical protein